jgi:GlpG protein
MIGTIPAAQDAERFSDYLLAQKIENMVEESPGGGAWSVWVEKDDDIDRGKSELNTFLTRPADTKYDAAAKTAEQVRRDQEKQQKRLRKKYVDVRTRWGQPKQWAAPITLTLIALSIVASIGTQLGRKMNPFGHYLYIDDRPRQPENPAGDPANNPADEFFRTGENQQDRPILQRVRQGEVWRLITPIFLHFSILHLLFNMFWLRDLGGMIETQRGPWTMLAAVLASAVIGNLAQYFWSLDTPSPFGFGGMSGVVYGLFGYVWIKQRFEPHLGLGLNEQSAMIMLAWLVICMTGMIGHVANAAHVAGLLSGAAIAYAPIAWRRAKRQLTR